MATVINEIACDLLRGGIRDLKEEVAVWRQPGVDGYGAHLTGLGDSDWQFEAVKYGVIADVIAWIQLIEALQGTIVTMTDDRAIEYQALLVVQVGQPQITPALIPSVPLQQRCAIMLRGVVTGVLYP